MRESVAPSAPTRHRELAEIRGVMAKADLPKAEISAARVRLGGVIQRALSLLGWTLDRLARELEMDARQVGRWMSGAERPHFDKLFAIDELRQPLVYAFAELVGESVEVRTQITLSLRRSA